LAEALARAYTASPKGGDDLMKGVELTLKGFSDGIKEGSRTDYIWEPGKDTGKTWPKGDPKPEIPEKPK
jgi:hypothetical protein